MRLVQRADELVVWAPAKVNLFLEVLGKRSDGYHEIATLMVAIGLYDTLTFKEDGGKDTTLSCNVPDLSLGSDNLIRRAAELLRRQTGCDRGVRVRLEKRIPMAGGLAGGSTDAAATLVALDRLWGLRRSPEELDRAAAQLGSDVPFFLHAPAAWCTGRGERVQPLAPGGRLWLVLLCPPVGVPTPEVYRRVQVPAAPADGSALRRAFERGDAEEVARRLHNRLEAPAVQARPELAAYREQLDRLVQAGTLLSGSGSTFFALCAGPDQALAVARKLRDNPGLKGCQVFAVRSCT